MKCKNEYKDIDTQHANVLYTWPKKIKRKVQLKPYVYNATKT
jgi:hypothetical protein